MNRDSEKPLRTIPVFQNNVGKVPRVSFTADSEVSVGAAASMAASPTLLPQPPQSPEFRTLLGVAQQPLFSVVGEQFPK